MRTRLEECSLETYLLYLTTDLVCPTSVVAYTVDRRSYISPSGPVESFPYKVSSGLNAESDLQGNCTIIERLESGKLIRVFLQQSDKLSEEDATIGAGSIQTPNGIEGLLSGLDGGVDVLGGGFGNGSNNLSIR